METSVRIETCDQAESSGDLAHGRSKFVPPLLQYVRRANRRRRMPETIATSRPLTRANTIRHCGAACRMDRARRSQERPLLQGFIQICAPPTPSVVLLALKIHQPSKELKPVLLHTCLLKARNIKPSVPNPSSKEGLGRESLEREDVVLQDPEVQGHGLGDILRCSHSDGNDTRLNRCGCMVRSPRPGGRERGNILHRQLTGASQPHALNNLLRNSRIEVLRCKRPGGSDHRAFQPVWREHQPCH